MSDKSVNFEKLSSPEKILFCTMVGNARQINRNGPACSYKENMGLYNSMKDVAKMLEEYDMTLDCKKVFGLQ